MRKTKAWWHVRMSVVVVMGTVCLWGATWLIAQEQPVSGYYLTRIIGTGVESGPISDPYRPEVSDVIDMMQQVEREEIWGWVKVAERADVWVIKVVATPYGHRQLRTALALTPTSRYLEKDIPTSITVLKHHPVWRETISVLREDWHEGSIRGL